MRGYLLSGVLQGFGSDDKTLKATFLLELCSIYSDTDLVLEAGSVCFLYYNCLLFAYNSDIIKVERTQKGDVFMAQATLTARVDEKDKASFDRFCSNVGLNTSTAINLFVKAVLRENRIPFEITQTSEPFFSHENLEYVKKSVQELRSGKGTAHELIEVDDE